MYFDLAISLRRCSIVAIADRQPEIILNRNYTNNFTIKDQILNSLVPKYYPDIDVNKLNIGMIGLTSEFMSTVTEDLFHSTSVLMNEYFPNRCIYNSSIYAHSALFGLDNNFASAASGMFVLSIEKRSLLEAMIAIDANSISNGVVNPLSPSTMFPVDGPFIIPKETEFHIMSNDKDYIFTPSYDIAIIARFTANNTWMFRAYYSNSRTPWYNFSLSNDKNSNIKIKEMKDGYIYLALHMFQKKNLEIDYNVTSNSIINVPEFFITIPEGMQVAGMDCAYKGPHMSDYTYMDHLQMYELPLSSPFCYYEFVDTYKLRISFGLNSSRFQPLFNSDVKVILYLTNGSAGNYSVYNGDVQVVKTPNFESNRRLMWFGTSFGPSSGGNNSLTMEELRSLTVSAYTSCGTTTTENDILRKFVDFNTRHHSMIRPIKKRDDLFERRYMAYTILKPLTREIYMHNTLHLLLHTDMFDDVNVVDQTTEKIVSYTLKSGKIFGYLNDTNPQIYTKIATNAPYFVRDDLAATAESLHMTCIPIGIPVAGKWAYIYCSVFDDSSGGSGYAVGDIITANTVDFVVVQINELTGAIMALAYQLGELDFDPSTDPFIPCPIDATSGSGTGAFVRILAHQATKELYNVYDAPLEELEALEAKLGFLYTSQFIYVCNLFENSTIDTVNIFDNNLKYDYRPDEVKIDDRVFTQFIASRFKIERSLRNNTEFVCSLYVSTIHAQEDIHEDFKYITSWLNKTVDSDFTQNNLRIFMSLECKGNEALYMEMYPEKVDKTQINPDEIADNVNVIKFRTVIRSSDGMIVSPLDESILFNVLNTRYQTYQDYDVGTDVDGYPLNRYKGYNTTDQCDINSSDEICTIDAGKSNVTIYIMYRPYSSDEISNAYSPQYGLPKKAKIYVPNDPPNILNMPYYYDDMLLMDYCRAAVYNTYDQPVDFYRQMDLINSTVLYNGWEMVAKEDDIQEVYKREYVTVKFLPFIKWNIFRETLPENPAKSEFYERFIPEFNFAYSELIKCIPDLANSMKIDMKYYNTYGKSANTFIADEQLIDRTSIKIYFKLFLKNESLFSTTADEVRKIIKRFIETLNDDGVNSIHVSNIIRTIEEEVINIDHLIYVNLNDYTTSEYQTIVNKTPDPDTMTKAQIYNYVPEFINILDSNIKLELGRYF